jgi:Fur family ferric uptake transcriptional regulator
MSRQTRQRDVIARVILDADGPLPVEEIYERARRAEDEVPNLGIATVYRTIKLLLAQERIVAVDLPGEQTHYEAAGRGHHHHFRCLECDRWFDLGTCIVRHVDGTTLDGGFVVDGHFLTLYGRCPDCAGANP